MSKPTMQTHFKVKNVHGTSNPRYAESSSKMASSWLKKWREETKSDRKTCCVIGCSSEDLVGGHVIIVDKRSDNSWWIAPICRGHNNFSNETEMFLDSRVTLVAVSPLW